MMHGQRNIRHQLYVTEKVKLSLFYYN